MRHVGSLLLALVLAPLAWVLTGVGLLKYNDVRVQFEDGLSVDILLGLLALLGAGALYAVLVLARLSPIGPALAGSGYLGAAVWYAVEPASFLDVFPYEVGDVDLGLPIPAAGLSAVLAVPLLATLVSPRRWRRYDRPPAAHAGAGPYPVPPGAPYGPPGAPYGAPPGYPAPPQGDYPAPTPGIGVPVPAGGLGTSSPVPTPQAPPGYGPPATTAFPAPGFPPAGSPPAGFPATGYPPAGSPSAPTTAFPPVPAPDYTRPPAAPQPAQASHESTQPVSPPAPSSGPPAPAPPTPVPAPGPLTPPAPPTPAPRPDAAEPTTTVLASGAGGGFGVSDDRPTKRLDTDETQLVKGPPPPDAYPRPAWSAPTPPPITPPKPPSFEPDDDDPEATQPRR